MGCNTRIFIHEACECSLFIAAQLLHAEQALLINISYSLNSLKGGYIEDYTGEYYRGY